MAAGGESNRAAAQGSVTDERPAVKRPPARPPARPLWRQLLPLALLLGLSLAAFFYCRAQGWDLDTVARHRAWLLAQVEAQPLPAGLGLFLLCLLVATLSLPFATLLTLVGGFLFGPLVATAWIVGGATLGSLAVFLAARGQARAALRARAGPWLARLERGFRRDAFSYLVVLRLLPIIPFWLVNLVPALLGVGLRTFLAATALGMTPVTFFVAELGGGLGEMMDAGRRPSLGLLLDLERLLPLAALALAALLPLLWRRLARPRAVGGA